MYADTAEVDVDVWVCKEEDDSDEYDGEEDRVTRISEECRWEEAHSC